MAIWVTTARKSGATMAARCLTRRNMVNGGGSCSAFPKSHHSLNALAGKKEKENSSSLLGFWRFKSTKASAAAAVDQLYSSDEDVTNNHQGLDFPGGHVSYTRSLNFISNSSTQNRVPCYRVLDDNGVLIPAAGGGSNSGDFQFHHHQQPLISQQTALKMYREMVRLQVMDTIFYEAQRQGRLSFYLTSTGEEAISVAAAAALTPDDVVMPQYREPGVLLWRGFTLREFADQCFGNKDDYGKGRQMPIHYGSNKLNYFTVSSPLATQIPQAAGVAYALKMEKKDACVVTFFGDGSSSEGDFHAGLNFAAVTESPVVFVCRNNGWAISTNVSEQFRSDGIVVKGQAYGIDSIRVDGNDALAVYNSIRAAREIAVKQGKPVLVEFLTYRVGHHSTSDDSTKYRPVDEIEYWKVTRNPVNRFRKWVEGNGWWNEGEESELRSATRKQLLQAIQAAERTEKPVLEEMFNDVYDETPSNLREQHVQLRETIKRHPGDYPSDVPV
ncbi:unnamed protein product [Linum trigynum]|uniref:3-methyl-2-oxobutanoate dehydrogenase (2-methylpropanoyl-transferring) n=1 Tax=Linum trigynum TaxID=586398 RepID=A0AAV2D0Z9_9ROSI